jgi:hypothetical protein
MELKWCLQLHFLMLAHVKEFFYHLHLHYRNDVATTKNGKLYRHNEKNGGGGEKRIGVYHESGFFLYTNVAIVYYYFQGRGIYVYFQSGDERPLSVQISLLFSKCFG